MPSEVTDKFRGKPGTVISVIVEREGKTITIPSIERVPLENQSILKKRFSPNVGYARITRFGNGTTRQFIQAVHTMNKNGELASLIIDVRDNGGGKNTEVLEILRLFTKNPNATVESIVHRNAENNFTIRAQDITPDNNNQITTQPSQSAETAKPELGSFTNIPRIIVLINHDSASASEALAAVLQEWKALVIGEKSFGKAVAQFVYRILDGSELWLTTSQLLYGEARRDINEKGIAPDIEVKWEKRNNQTDENFILERMNALGDPKRDPQLQKALEILQEKITQSPVQ